MSAIFPTLNIRRTCGMFLCLALGSSLSNAAVNDVLPADYFPLPENTTAVALYAIDRQQTGPFSRGQLRMDGFLGSQIAALRISKSMKVGEHSFAPMLVLGWVNSQIEPTGLANALGRDLSGLADLRIGGTAWFLEDKDRGEYAAFTGTLIFPSGSYNRLQLANPGENRYRLIFSGGWIRPLFWRDLLLEISPEVAIYGTNNSYAGTHQLTQQNSVALTSYLRYRISPSFQIHVGWQGNNGGSTSIDGINQHNPANNQRAMLGSTWLLPSGQQVILRLAKDTRLSNGFRTDSEITIRYLKML